MEKIRKFYKNNMYEDFNILYKDNYYMLIQNDMTKKYTFGLIEDFNSFYWFPVNQSCLTREECIKTLNRFIEIDKEYHNINKTMQVYENMLKALKEC